MAHIKEKIFYPKDTAIMALFRILFVLFFLLYEFIGIPYKVATELSIYNIFIGTYLFVGLLFWATLVFSVFGPFYEKYYLGSRSSKIMLWISSLFFLLPAFLIILYSIWKRPENIQKEIEKRVLEEKEKAKRIEDERVKKVLEQKEKEELEKKLKKLETLEHLFVGFLQKHPVYLNEPRDYSDDESIYTDLEKLKIVLSNKYGIEIDDDNIYSFMQKTKTKEVILRLKEITSKDTNPKDCAVKYLNIYGENSQITCFLEGFIQFMRDKFKIDEEKSNSILSEVIETLELENYESELAAGTSHKKIDEMSGFDFQDHISNLLEQKGYKVTKTPKTKDYGIDIIAEKFGKKVGIQCKRYKENVGASAIRDAHSGSKYYNCGEAWVITNSGYSKEAIKSSTKLNVKIINDLTQIR